MSAYERTPRPTTLAGHLLQGLKGFMSLIIGLKVTGKNFVAPQVTVHYPRQTVTHDQLAGYRGHIELVPHPDDPDKSRCILCFKCMSVCPSQCISITKNKQVKPVLQDDARHSAIITPALAPMLPPDKIKPSLASYHLDFTLCSLCGLCVQSCPAAAIRHSSNVYLASADHDDFHFDLLARLHDQARKGRSVQDGEVPSMKEAV